MACAGRAVLSPVPSAPFYSGTSLKCCPAPLRLSVLPVLSSHPHQHLCSVPPGRSSRRKGTGKVAGGRLRRAEPKWRLAVRMRTRQQEQAVSRLPTQLWMHQLWPAMLPLSQTCTCWEDLSLKLRLSTSLFPLRIHPLLFNCILYRHCWPGFPLVLASLYRRQHVVMHAAAIRTPHSLQSQPSGPRFWAK